MRLMPIAREGVPFVVAPLVAVAVCFAGGLATLGIISLGVAAVMAFFFRDPDREIPRGDGLILSPADGRVVAVQPFDAWRGMGGEALSQVSIFLSVLDVHVNRAPLAGVVNEVTHRPGRFHVAWAPKASTENEQNLIRLAAPQADVWVKQIAGILARRIVCRVKAGHKVQAGERIGLIRFGSRVDLILPAATALRVRIGDPVHGGSTVIGVLQ